MTEYGTIKIPRDEFEKHNEKRQAAGLSWAEYLNEEAARPTPDADIAEEVRELRKAIRNDSEGKSEAISNASERDAEALVTPVINRIDDLETELTKQHDRMSGP